MNRFLNIFLALLVAVLLGSLTPAAAAPDPSGDTGSQVVTSGQQIGNFPGTIPEYRFKNNVRIPNQLILGGTLNVNNIGNPNVTQWSNIPALIARPAGKNGSALDTNIIFSTPAAARTYTVPDAGGNANFLFDQGVTSAITIQHVAVPLSSANILGMFATPVQLIPAGAAGTNIVVHKAMLTMTTTATQYASGGPVVFQLGSAAAGAGTATTASIAAAVVNATAGTSYTTVIPVSYTGTAATGLFISNQTGAFTTGTGTGVVDIWYSIK